MLGAMNVALPRSLNVDQFLAWAVQQEEGKYELIDGVVVMQQSQQWGHAKTKLAITMALYEAVRKEQLPFYVAVDGPTVRVAERVAFVPDAIVAALPEPAWDSLEIANPVIVVEVLSPSTARVDATIKLRGYFDVATVQHYLIVDSEAGTIVHHRRTDDGALQTRVVSEGELTLDPPGVVIPLNQVFPTGHAPTA
jgi:Uma2 family endonuclease